MKIEVNNGTVVVVVVVVVAYLAKPVVEEVEVEIYCSYPRQDVVVDQ
jgi:hypothetical protein